ncbi:L-alanine-DL-glutamate epimerase [Massilia sp. PDC64]|nr:dipeptide epimerase [Massilia sp. PDC64]SDE80126.1 L-alanine-DL-glutamate epimerase [Massilia sp. PDC64]
MSTAAPVRVEIAHETWDLDRPFTITGHTHTFFDGVVLTLRDGHYAGRGEALGVPYKGETAQSIRAQLEALRGDIEAGHGRALTTSMPVGGARNALDCALWELEAQRAGRPVWQLLGLPRPRNLPTTYTIGANPPDVMAAQAREWRAARALKLKLTGEPVDAARVRAVRAARPDAWIGVDGNRGFTPAALDELMPVLVDARVQLIEQPFDMADDGAIDALDTPIPLAADESIQDLADLEASGRRWDVVNIKLDKCGGLTEGMLMAHTARRMGLKVMVGSMGGTSLSMAPAFQVGQLCDIVDLDAPILLRRDRDPGVVYRDGAIWCGDEVWGGAPARA